MTALQADGIEPKLRLAIVSLDRKSTRLNSNHSQISYAVFCLKKKKKTRPHIPRAHPPNSSRRAHLAAVGLHYANPLEPSVCLTPEASCLSFSDRLALLHACVT